MSKFRFAVLATLALFVGLAFLPAPQTATVSAQEEGDPAVLAKMHQINDQMRAMGLNIAIEEIHLISFGQGRPANRIHQTGLRWVAGDPRRLADGNNITYLVDQSDGATTSGLTNAQTEAAIDRAMNTWDAHKCLDKTNIIKRADSGADPDIFDFFFGFGGFGNPFLADITEAGWLPAAFFEAVGGPGGGNGILAFSVSFIFIDGAGNPTDINGDNYLDTALNEVYYNDNFGSPGPRLGNPWRINQPLPAIDVETVALHENGHSLGLGHFGPPPAAVMNPVYAGIRQSPLSIDSGGMCAVWGSWPK
jgi:matrixin